MTPRDLWLQLRASLAVRALTLDEYIAVEPVLPRAITDGPIGSRRRKSGARPQS